jgi:hypothetical protein
MHTKIMKLFIYSIISFGVFVIPSTNANEIPNSIEFQDNKLMLNGKGTRVVFFMKVYEGSLYLETNGSDANKIINADDPMALRIDVTSTMVTADAMRKALNDGLAKSTGNNTGPIIQEINQLSSSFDSGVSEGDYYEFIYLPKIGTHVIKNNNLVEIIPGLAFKKAFFGIFLSDNPIQKNLKKALLGG